MMLMVPAPFAAFLPDTGSHKDRNKIILEHAEIADRDGGQEPQQIASDTGRSGDKLRSPFPAPRISSLRDRVVKESGNITDSAGNTGACSAERPADKKSIGSV